MKKNKKFWAWKNQADEGSEPERVLELYGTIAEESWFDDDVTPQMFRDELFAGSGRVTIWLNSPGGDCVAASQIYSMLMDYKDDVIVKIDGIAASAASVIAMAGTTVLMAPTALMMIHNPITAAFGNHEDMERAISMLDEVKESIINAYAAKTGLSRNKIAKLMSDETWMNARKAVELGFADEIMFDDKKSDPASEPVEEDTDGSDTPEEGENGEIHLESRSMEGLLYSTRTMDRMFLNSLGLFEEGEARSEGSAEEKQAADAGTDEDKASDQKADSKTDTGEDKPEGEATPVAEDTAVAEDSVSIDDATVSQPVEPTSKSTDAVKADSTSPVPERKDEGEGEKPDTSDEEDEVDEGEPTEEQKPDEKPSKAPSANILPDGFIAIDQNGRTPDGSVPYFILKNQLDRMR